MQHKTLSRGLYPGGGGGRLITRPTRKRFKTSYIAVLIKFLYEFTRFFLVPKRLKKVEFILIQARVGLMTECILFVYR